MMITMLVVFTIFCHSYRCFLFSHKSSFLSSPLFLLHLIIPSHGFGKGSLWMIFCHGLLGIIAAVMA
ncbi:hypothetical protein L596_001516 [Steinernema carpocapsae]|uniref:Uncharacterized protein n=1 Tax=Steinernema carpocapsae TaxID=34508 RepID=A0A4U8ULG8_STECR|nr:hypothetical protein L596_001516 [Steinernema carpocapsae]